MGRAKGQRVEGGENGGSEGRGMGRAEGQRVEGWVEGEGGGERRVRG